MPVVPFSPKTNLADSSATDDPNALTPSTKPGMTELAIAAYFMHQEEEARAGLFDAGVKQLKQENGPGPMPMEPAGSFAKLKQGVQMEQAKDIGTSFRKNRNP